MKAMIGIVHGDSRFIGKRAWMTRKISAESWKVAVFEISLSSWVNLEWFTQRNYASDNRTLSLFFDLNFRFLSFWVGGLPLINIYIVFLILIRGYSITQGKPFYSIYNIYIYYIYIYIRYLDSRTTTKFPWVNHSRELKELKGIGIWRKNRATDLFPVIIRARLLCDLSLKNDAEKLIQLEDYRVKIIFV